MQKLLVSFERENLYVGNSDWLFPTRQIMRFEWLALLALKRVSVPIDQAWVTLKEIGRLPHWAGKNAHHIGTNVGRYLQAPELIQSQIVAAQSRWTGPYQLAPAPLLIEFDIPLGEVRKRLRLRRSPAAVHRDKLFRFTASYTRSQWLLFRGKLLSPKQDREAESAYKLLMSMASEQWFNPTLRLLARLGAGQVLFRLGRFGAARDTLLKTIPLAQRIPDRALKAQFYLALAWSYQRASSGPVSDRDVEKALTKATAYAEDSGDRAALGLLAHRTGGYLTKKGRHAESVNQYLLALEAFLITGNYDLVQASCGNLGSVIHRLGPAHYAEARRWLLLGTTIARWMRLGREDAHGEMILGKIHTERGNRAKAYVLLKRAERIAERSGNQLNLADVKMVWAFWHQKFGTSKDERDTLVNALRIFRRLKDFDSRQKEKYMARKFPEVWAEVIEAG